MPKNKAPSSLPGPGRGSSSRPAMLETATAPRWRRPQRHLPDPGKGRRGTPLLEAPVCELVLIFRVDALSSGSSQQRQRSSAGPRLPPAISCCSPSGRRCPSSSGGAQPVTLTLLAPRALPQWAATPSRAGTAVPVPRARERITAAPRYRSPQVKGPATQTPSSWEEGLQKKAFNLDFYTEVLDLSYLVDHLASDPFFQRYRCLNEKLVEVIEDYSLVSFVPLNVQDKDSMRQVIKAVDKANGYCFGDAEQRTLEAMMSAAVGADFQFTTTLAIQDKYVEPENRTVEQEAMAL